MNRVHRKKQRGSEGEASVPEDSFVTGVHQDEGHETVQNHIHRMEVEWVHASQKYVQPV